MVSALQLIPNILFFKHHYAAGTLHSSEGQKSQDLAGT